MKNSSLGVEPPSKFDGKKKEVYGKNRNRAFSSLSVSLEDDKNKNRSINSAKNIEKKVIFESQMYNLDINYLKNSERFAEGNSTSTNKSVEFTRVFNTNFNQIISEFNYEQITNDEEFAGKKISKFYDMNSSYFFTPKVREEYKKDNLYNPPEEQKTKEISYPIYDFDEATKQEN